MNLIKNVSDIVQLSKSKIARDSSIVLTGNILSAGLGFIATILITRTLGPAQFGLFSVALAVMGIASQFSDFGVGTGMVRFASLYLKNDYQKANLIFKVSLKLKLIAAASIFLIGFFASKSLAIHVFVKPELIFPLKLAFIGAFGTSLLGYVSTTLQARQSFKKFTLVNLIDPLIKVSVIGLLFLTYKLNLLSALTTVIILPFIAFLIGSLIIPKDFLKAKGNEKEVFHELYHFSKWVMISFFVVLIVSRLDVFMLTYFRTVEEVGYYSAAFTFSSAFNIITGSFVTVLLPKITAHSEKNELKKYIVKILKYSGVVAIILLSVIPFSESLILFIYGNAYYNSIIVFKILVTAFILGFVISPVSIVFYSINRPDILAYMNLLQLASHITGGLLLIPMYGGIGTALNILIASIVGGIYLVICLKMHFGSD